MEGNTDTNTNTSKTFYTYTHSIVASAANFMEELLDQFEVDIVDDDSSSSQPNTNSKNEVLPWEVLETPQQNNTTTFIRVAYPDLQAAIFQISHQKMSDGDAILTAYAKSQQKSTLDFRHHKLMLQRMMTLDKNLAKQHSRLCSRQVKEKVFWNYYLLCVRECQQDFFRCLTLNDSNSNSNSKKKFPNNDNTNNKMKKIVVGQQQVEDPLLGEKVCVSMHGTKMYEDFVVV